MTSASYHGHGDGFTHQDHRLSSLPPILHPPTSHTNHPAPTHPTQRPRHQDIVIDSIAVRIGAALVVNDIDAVRLSLILPTSHHAHKNTASDGHLFKTDFSHRTSPHILLSHLHLMTTPSHISFPIIQLRNSPPTILFQTLPPLTTPPHTSKLSISLSPTHNRTLSHHHHVESQDR